MDAANTLALRTSRRGLAVTGDGIQQFREHRSRHLLALFPKHFADRLEILAFEFVHQSPHDRLESFDTGLNYLGSKIADIP
jgi:hypothetical protein